ncbi:MAG: hypothetical protein KAH84_00305 [Thiomargarita sp.]|nr:hypothetical protein [Thiomargarita sp.]
MQDYFYNLADFINSKLQSEEVYLCELIGEQSDFVRFNQGSIRQAGKVEQYYLKIELIKGQYHATGELTLGLATEIDQQRITALLTELREKRSHLPADPYLLYATEKQSTESIGKNQLPDAEEMITDILPTIKNHDFVGIYAAGGMFTGFANSFGQRNWHSSYPFNIDWSIYHNTDKAVKSAYAGFDWKATTFQDKITQSVAQLEILKRKPHTIKPGKYKVYLSPSAVHEILLLLSWNGFGLKAQRTKDSSLLRMLTEPRQNLSTKITLLENTTEGIAPAFQSQGFIKPPQVTFISAGRYDSALVSPRSAKEYQVNTNGGNEEEIPLSFDLLAGQLAVKEVLKTLDTGVYVNNLWYLNYSDRVACRMTGMTRFATFWVENGEIVAPLNVMRFDETLYQLLGDKLVDLTTEREFIMDTDSYERRSNRCANLPGALVEDFTFTL